MREAQVFYSLQVLTCPKTSRHGVSNSNKPGIVTMRFGLPCAGIGVAGVGATGVGATGADVTGVGSVTGDGDGAGCVFSTLRLLVVCGDWALCCVLSGGVALGRGLACAPDSPCVFSVASAPPELFPSE